MPELRGQPHLSFLLRFPTKDITKNRTLGFGSVEASGQFDRMSEKVREELQHVFNPEFLNRIDDIIVFHVLDPSELDFTFPDASSFEDLESGEQLPIVPEGLRDEYRALVKAHTDALQKRFAANRVDYAVLDTSKPLDFALFSYLNMRERLMRSR